MKDKKQFHIITTFKKYKHNIQNNKLGDHRSNPKNRKEISQ